MDEKIQFSADERNFKNALSPDFRDALKENYPEFRRRGGNRA